MALKEIGRWMEAFDTISIRSPCVEPFVCLVRFAVTTEFKNCLYLIIFVRVILCFRSESAVFR
jgi:hypothetical protein